MARKRSSPIAGKHRTSESDCADGGGPSVVNECNYLAVIELLHDFVLFDGGEKKLPRVHQYFGIKKAQERVNAYEGGIIWHTQGSGKSIVMVLLAKWILENNPNARVLILTDRDELDKQIERVFTGRR
jgi:type I restriction enzyme R subunit